MFIPSVIDSYFFYKLCPFIGQSSTICNLDSLTNIEKFYTNLKLFIFFCRILFRSKLSLSPFMVKETYKILYSNIGDLDFYYKLIQLAHWFQLNNLWISFIKMSRNPQLTNKLNLFMLKRHGQIFLINSCNFINFRQFLYSSNIFSCP